ncbi:MAG: nucleotidyltransferase [Mediterraneibacter sp.]
MSIQSEFLNFHERIKLDYGVKSELADKRDVLLGILRNSGRLPGFDEFNQGSYGMYLGVEPTDGREYDIDVGLRFNADKADYDPMEIKNIIADILDGHTDYGTVIKKPCVTVTYKKNGEPTYHVDLVTYLYENCADKESQLYLARGKDSKPEEIKWEKSDPVGLVDYINDKIDKGNERDQFRRIIRYIKRWKNRRFNSWGHAEPASIGITLSVVDNFTAWLGDDLSTLLSAVKSIQSLFQIEKFEDGRWLYRIKYPMPSSLKFEDNTDAFEKMTDIQMTDFKEKLEKLIRDLEAVQSEADEIEQCKKLQKIFGEDFHVPETKNISKVQHNYIPPSSASGVIK